jgi:5-methylcytosine-specific restriction endonuclease McrA
MPRWPGYVVSDETRSKIGARSRAQSAESRARSLAVLHSPEVRERSHAGQVGVPCSDRRRAAISAAKMGKPGVSPSLETRERQRIANLNLSVLGECAYCLGPATGYDHIIPRGRPGWDDADNVVLACQPCNSSKSDRTPEEWFAGVPPVCKPSVGKGVA